MLQYAHFRFFYSLNDFLSANDQGSLVTYKFSGTPAIKDAIEAIGIPHTEVDVILANAEAVGFFYPLKNNDRVEVYPALKSPVFPPYYSISPPNTDRITFVADVHLGKLAKALRILGFDTCYQNNYSNKEIASIAENENRIVLTRDVGLLKHKSLRWGYWLRSQKPEKQAEEVIEKFNLSKLIAPFKRCLACNGEIESVEKEVVLEELPPKTIQYFNEFFRCSNCKKVYWRGSHYDHMMQIVRGLIK